MSTTDTFSRQDRMKYISVVQTDDGVKLVLDRHVAECVNGAWYLSRVEEGFDIKELGYICPGDTTEDGIKAAKRHMLVAIDSIGPSGHRRYSRAALEQNIEEEDLGNGQHAAAPASPF